MRENELSEGQDCLSLCLGFASQVGVERLQSKVIAIPNSKTYSIVIETLNNREISTFGTSPFRIIFHTDVGHTSLSAFFLSHGYYSGSPGVLTFGIVCFQNGIESGKGYGEILIHNYILRVGSCVRQLNSVIKVVLSDINDCVL